MKQNLACSLLLAVLAAGLWSCIQPVAPAPLGDGSCPGRFINCRTYKVWPQFYRLAGGVEQLQFGLEIPAKTSLLISLPAGQYRVVTKDAAGTMLGNCEILVAVPGSTLFELSPPELGVEHKETLYWWVKLEENPK